MERDVACRVDVGVSRALHIQRKFLYTEGNLKELILGKDEERLIETRQLLSDMESFETGVLFASLLGIVASPGDKSSDQDLREGALTILEQINLRRLAQSWILNTYLGIEKTMGPNSDPEGNIEALMRVRELIKNSFGIYGDFGQVLKSSESTDIWETQEINQDTGQPFTFEEILISLREKFHLSNVEFSLRLGYNPQYLSKRLTNGPPKNEKFYRELVKMGIKPQIVLRILKCSGAPWLSFIEELEASAKGSNKDGLYKDDAYPEVLRELRERIGLSRKEFATVIGCDVSYVTRVETGGETGRLPFPQEETYRKLLRIKGVEVEDILRLLRCYGAPWYAFIGMLKNGSTSARQGGRI